MKPATRTWTGIAVMTFVLTIAEGAALYQGAQGASRWWSGEQAHALRTAGTVVGSMVSERLAGRSRMPLAVELASMRDALTPLAYGGAGDCPRSIVVIRGEKGESRRVVRTIRHVELREALHQLDRQSL